MSFRVSFFQRFLTKASPGFGVRSRGRRTTLVGENRDYKRFVIFSYPRCGSTLIYATLAQHPAVQCYSEVFNQKFPMLFTEGMVYPSPWTLEYRQRQPLNFLNEFVFGAYPLEIRAVGFKIFPGHCANGRFQPVVDQLLRDPGICLFHLRRRNKMAVLLSLRRAQITNIWSDRGGTKQQQVALLEFSVEDCEQFFTEMAESERKMDVLLESRGDCHQLIYEDFIGEFDRSMVAMQEALEVEVFPLAPGISKQNTRPLADGIANFDELKSAFAGTPWQEYFEDRT